MAKKKRENLTIDAESFRFEVKEHTPFTDLVLDMIGDWLKYMVRNEAEKKKVEEEAKPEVKEPAEKTEEKLVEEKPVEKPRWTKDEDKIVIEDFFTMTAPAIKRTKLPHRSVQAIYDRAHFLKIHKLKRLAEKKKPTDKLKKQEKPEAKEETPVEVKPSVEPVLEEKEKPVEEETKPVEEEPVEKPEVKEEIPVEPEVKPEMSLQDRMSAPFKETLHSYGNTTIYNEVYVHLLKTLPDKFNYKNVYELIDRIYKEKPKRELKDKTLETYTGRYIDYMKMNEKIEIDKKSGMFMMIQKISELPEEVKEPKIARPGLLKQYGTTSIWKPVLDFILDNVDDRFSRIDVIKLVGEYYLTVLKREISKESVVAYVTCYVRYMKEDALIERCVDPNVPGLLYRLIKKPVEKKEEEKQEKLEAEEEKKKPEKPEEKLVKTHWTEDEDKILIECRPLMTVPAIKLAELPHRSEKAIYDRLRFLKKQKIKPKKKSKITEKVEPKVDEKKEEPVEPEKPSKPELKEKPVEKPKKKIILSKTAKDIYALAEKNNWPGRGGTGIPISVSLIEERLSYSSNEIKDGLRELIKADFAWQRNPGKIKFKTAR